MPQLNHVTADAARQLLLQQQTPAPKVQLGDLETLVNFSQILGGLIMPSEAAPIQTAETTETAEPRIFIRERTEIESRPETVRNLTESGEPSMRQPTEDISEGTERQTVSEPTEIFQAEAPEASEASVDPVLLQDGQVQTLPTDGGAAEVVQAGETTAMAAPVENFGSKAQLFDPGFGATADVVEATVAEPLPEPQPVMVDFLSGRSLGLKGAPVEAQPVPEEVLQPVTAESAGNGSLKPGTEILPEFRSMVTKEQTEAGTQNANERPLLADAQVRTAASANAALLKETTVELSQAQAQNAAPTSLTAVMNQVTARVEVSTAEPVGSPVAATAASKAEGVPGVRSAILAEGSQTLRQEAQRVNQAEMIERIVRMTKAGVNRGKQEVRLVLNPPELGGMKIHLKLSNGTLDATIRTDTMHANQLVNANLAELRQALADAGLDIGYLEVLLTEGDTQSGGRSTFEEQLHQHRAGAEAKNGGHEVLEPELVAASAYSMGDMSTIDIRV